MGEGPVQGKEQAGAAERGQPRPRETPRPRERANAQLKTWQSSASSAAAHGAPGNSPRPSSLCSFARRTQDGKGSMQQRILIGITLNPKRRDHERGRFTYPGQSSASAVAAARRSRCPAGGRRGRSSQPITPVTLAAICPVDYRPGGLVRRLPRADHVGRLRPARLSGWKNLKVITMCLVPAAARGGG